MDNFIVRLISLLENYYLATYIIAGSAVGVGIEIIGLEFFSNLFWMNLAMCYFTGMITSRVSSLIIEPFCLKYGFVKKEPYEKYLLAESKDKSGKLISMLKVSSIYCTMSAAALIVFLASIIKTSICWHLISSFDKKTVNICYAMGSALVMILFLFSYRKQNHYVVSRIKHLTTQNETSN